jgi:hypothetical protein
MNMRRISLCVLVIVLFAVLGCSKSESSKVKSSSPSKDETIQFLKDKIKLAGGNSYNAALQELTMYTINNFDIDNSGKIEYTRTQETPNKKITQRETIYLKDLNYSSVSVRVSGDRSAIDFSCQANKKPCISGFGDFIGKGNLSNSPQENNKPYQADASYIVFVNETNLAKRVSEALAHLINLYGGKGEAF